MPLLGIAGPFLPGSKKLFTAEELDITGILRQESFDKNKLDALLRKYLAQFEEKNEEDDDVKVPDEDK